MSELYGPFFLCLDSGPCDFDCPNCGRHHEVDWQTEYGYPYDGKYDVECVACLHKFHLTVTSVTRYSTESKED